MKDQIIRYYNRTKQVYDIVKPLNTEATTIHTKASKDWAQELLNFMKDVSGFDKETSYNIEDRGDLIKFKQGKLTIWLQVN